MTFRLTALIGSVAVSLVLLAAPVASGQGRDGLQMYTVHGPAGEVAEATQGVELAGVHQTASGTKAEAVLTRGQVSKLRASGVSVKLTRNKKGQTVAEQAAAMSVNGFNVWRSWDEQGGIRDELYRLARQNPQLLKLEVLGHTHQGRELIALKLTQGAREVPDGSRPAVLYSSLQHAREWITVEVNRRTLLRFINRWRANDTATKNLLKSTELWFVIVANPDGYQYTFDTERLWRKNLRENDGDGVTTRADGVDPNRNYPSHWGYDNEGSSPQPNSDTYRGPSAASEPETQAIMSLFGRVPFRFQVNYHSFGPYLLYPEGWQTSTATADDPIYYALTGNKDNPAIPDSFAGLSSDVLYVTNGEM